MISTIEIPTQLSPTVDDMEPSILEIQNNPPESLPVSQ
jgi:hypothetical protein